MADQPRNHPLRTLANRLIDTLGIRDAVDGAIKAANESGLPQGVGGPVDVALNGPDFSTFEGLQRWARGKITEAAPFNGDGQDGRVLWHRKPARGWRPDWSHVPLLSIERGGPEHHWRSKPGSRVPGRMGGTGPFERVLATWSREDIAAIMQSEAYRRSAHPDHARAQASVRAWFERKYADGRAALAPTAPRRREMPGRRGSAERAVHVRAHTREGGTERVRAHTRSRPD
jgi:hypothetical protein